MRWVRDKVEFEKVVLDARTCVHIDSRRLPTSLQLLVFDDPMVCTDYFLRALKSLMEWSRDSGAYLAVLDPHPVDSFYRLFSKYPVLEIMGGDSTEAYLGALNEDPGGGASYELSNFWWIYVIVRPSNRWFIHAIRSDADDSGHLWVPPELVNELLAAHPGVFRYETASPGQKCAGAPETCSVVP